MHTEVSQRHATPLDRAVICILYSTDFFPQCVVTVSLSQIFVCLSQIFLEEEQLLGRHHYKDSTVCLAWNQQS